MDACIIIYNTPSVTYLIVVLLLPGLLVLVMVYASNSYFTAQRGLSLLGLMRCAQVGSHISIGQELELTIDLFTCAGAIILCHPCKMQVAEDEATIRRMELDGSLFQLASFMEGETESLVSRSNAE